MSRLAVDALDSRNGRAVSTFSIQYTSTTLFQVGLGVNALETILFVEAHGALLQTLGAGIRVGT